MKVKLLNDGLLIEPETEFEEQYMHGMNSDLIAFKKCGSTPSDLIGIKITIEKQK